MVAISEVAEVNPGFPKTSNFTPESLVSFLPMAAVSESGEIISQVERPFGEVSKGYTYFAEGDVLMAKITPCMENGKATFVHKLKNPAGFGSTEFHVLRPGSEIDGKYLFYMIWNPLFRKVAGRNMTGTAGQKRVPSSFLKDFKISLPPLPEQKRIAAILDKADSIRRKRQESVRLTEDLLRSVFLDMFGDPVTNPKGWKLGSLKELGKVKTGGTPPGSKSDMFGGNIPFITPGDLGSCEPVKRTVTEEGAAEAETVRSGASLVCCIGATIGKMSKAKQRSAFNQQINAVEWFDNVNDDYGIGVLHFFKKQIATSGSSTTLPILKKSSFEQIEIPVPPLDKQQEFARRICAIGKLKDSHRYSTLGSETLFNSLLQRAFKGVL